MSGQPVGVRAEPALRGSQSALRAISILELFGETGAPLTIAEISEATSLTASTAYRLTRALHSRGLLSLDPAGVKYTVGPATVRLARLFLNQDIVQLAEPALERLHGISGETVSLQVRSHSARICLSEISSRHPIRIVSGVGQTYPLHRGAAGKAISSLLAYEELRQAAASAPQDEVPSELSLDRDRERGYSESLGETITGAAAVAAAFVFPPTGDVYALNITGPADRFTDDLRQACVPQLREQIRLILAATG